MAFDICLRVGGWVVLILCGTPLHVLANVGPPSTGGHVVGEPVGILDVAITRETLTIDLRPLVENGLARVEAVYHLHNRGGEKTLDLLFAAGSTGTTDFQVWLGEDSIPSSRATATEIPPSWAAPKQTPGLQAGEQLDYLSYGRNRLVPWAFTVAIPRGMRTLKVRYSAEVATHFYGRPTVYRQFAYVLAPARSWAGFGGLDVTVHLPKDWKVACTPALTRRGDTLAGSFDDLPADAIALTVQAPKGWAYAPFRYGSLVLFGLTGFGGALFCWRYGRSLGRRLAVPVSAEANEHMEHMWVWTLGSGVAWSLAVLVTGVIAVFGPESVLPSHQVTRYGYGQAFALLGVLFLSIMAAPTGYAIVQITATLTRHQVLHKASL